MPRAIVLRAPGTNCDAELCRAFSLAGAAVELRTLREVCAAPAALDSYDLIAFPGGFSYGDDVASGRIFALHTRQHLYGPLCEAVARGACVIGVCNGFQVLVQCGLLPGPDAGEEIPSAAPAATLALTDNADGRFHDRWNHYEVNSRSGCVWTRGLDRFPADLLMFPMAHGEGRLWGSAEAIDRLERTGSVALRYVENTNGSCNRIAGVCDATGRVFGLMPHPERFLSWLHHPFWTRLDPAARQGPTPGQMLFSNAVEAVSKVHA
ncbi:MAG: phosphoribosylformylglycinamidine synthase subunit PurQ [Phycisphaeraceae bacterium]|nr:phosphoribosylformylglycinamidine synthase subunit PurQ [Phycisphaeraceae bacterium]